MSSSSLCLSSSFSSSSSSSEEELIRTREEILARVEKIATQPNAHPFSQLQELYQARLILSVGKEDLAQVVVRPGTIVQRVQVNTEIGVGNAVTFTGEGPSKKVAQREAARAVFETVVTYLRHSPPRVLFDVVVPTCKSEGPTRNQLKEMEQDQANLSVLREIACEASWGPLLCEQVGILSIDLEQWEEKTWINTEVGVAFRHLPSASPTMARHFIVSEHVDKVNGRHVPNHKWDFNFGESQLVSEERLGETVSQLLADLCRGCDKVFLVGHTLKSDLKWLEEIKVTLPKGLVPCDIALAYRALKSKGKYSSVTGMERMLEELNIEAVDLHNGGNDAHYNIEVVLRMIRMAGEEAEKKVDGGS